MSKEEPSVNTPNGDEHDALPAGREILDDETPTSAAELYVVLEPFIDRAQAEVARTRRRGVSSLVATAALTICVILITSLTSLGSHELLVVLISAAISVALGSSLGFFLSLPGKSDRYKRLTVLLDTTRGRAVKGKRDQTSGSSDD